jgi:hypothetical protein
VRLTLIGYWLGEHEPGWPDAHSFVDSRWSSDEREAVIDWLESGVGIRFFLGPSRCRLCGRHNGSSEASDGTYLWPAGLAHYVREHGVRLPTLLVERALQRPAVDRSQLESAEREDEDLSVDYQWWRNQRPDWKRPREHGS